MSGGIKETNYGCQGTQKLATAITISKAEGVKGGKDTSRAHWKLGP